MSPSTDSEAVVVNRSNVSEPSAESIDRKIDKLVTAVKELEKAVWSNKATAPVCEPNTRRSQTGV